MQLNFAMTTIPTILLWVLGLLIFGIGGFLGYFNMNIEARKKIETMEMNVEITRADAEKKLAEAQLLKSQLPEGVAEPSLLRIKADKAIEMDGAVLAQAKFSAEKRKRLLELVSLLRPYLDTPIQPAQSAQPVSSTPAAEPAPVRMAAAQTPSLQNPSITSSLMNVAAGQPAKKKDAEQEFKLLSIVQQIDSVLQRRIINTPLEDRGIRLTDSPQGTVEVYIGLQKYDSIDDVPDEVVKSAIRAAIAEWEKKYVPGM